jgi:hypothetical protein
MECYCLEWTAVMDTVVHSDYIPCEACGSHVCEREDYGLLGSDAVWNLTVPENSTLSCDCVSTHSYIFHQHKFGSPKIISSITT